MDKETPPILSVSQLTNAIKINLETTFPLIWVQGEISNSKLQSSGHYYFSLKDSGAQISAVMFKGDVSKLAVVPKDGDNVIVRGELNVYPANGKYQIIIRELRHVGLGELLLKLEELKVKINKRGWFKKEHKKPIPKFPKKIGIITSPTGAAIQDILNVLTRRFSGFHVILNPVRVQGVEAPGEIVKAIRQFNEYNLVDVIILGRGGGSIEDLWAFNDEAVAEAVFYSKIPIICAVGHETDHCIAEYVADVRAPTPSAAAEIVIAEKAQQIHYLDQLSRRLDAIILQRLDHHRKVLGAFKKQSILSTPDKLVGPWMQKLDDLKEGIDLAMSKSLVQWKSLLQVRRQHVESFKPTTQIKYFRERLVSYDRALQQSILQQVSSYKGLLKQHQMHLERAWTSKQQARHKQFDPEAKGKQLNYLINHLLKVYNERLMATTTTLRAIDPKSLLSKGYSIIFSEKSGTVIRSVLEMKKGENLRLLVSDGEAISTINEVKKRD